MKQLLAVTVIKIQRIWQNYKTHIFQYKQPIAKVVA